MINDRYDARTRQSVAKNERSRLKTTLVTKGSQVRASRNPTGMASYSGKFSSVWGTRCETKPGEFHVTYDISVAKFKSWARYRIAVTKLRRAIGRRFRIWLWRDLLHDAARKYAPRTPVHVFRKHNNGISRLALSLRIYRLRVETLRFVLSNNLFFLFQNNKSLVLKMILIVSNFCSVSLNQTFQTKY